MVLEQVLVEHLDPGPNRDKRVRRQHHVAVADVFGRQGEQHLLHCPVILLAREEIEQDEECQLASVGQRDVARADVPAELLSQQIGQGRDEFAVAFRRIVLPHRPLETPPIGEQRRGAGAKAAFDLRDLRGIAAAEHVDRPRLRRRGAEIVHELPDARLNRDLPTEFRELHHVDTAKAVRGVRK